MVHIGYAYCLFTQALAYWSRKRSEKRGVGGAYRAYKMCEAALEGVHDVKSLTSGGFTWGD